MQAWQDEDLTDQQAAFLDKCIREELLPTDYSQISGVNDLLQRYQEIEADIPLPTRVPGLVEADAFDQPLFERGNHRKPLQPVARRFLSAIDDQPYRSDNSGRLKLADDVIRSDNPLTARVIVNRLWHYAYGQGLVRTTDNFGKLGEEPSHPELLDYLATRFVQDGWSIKEALRFIMTSKSWQMQSRPSQKAATVDPENRLLSHANGRRLDAEAIRDAMLSVAGELDPDMFGKAVRANSETTRRSIYVACRRNSLDRFLTVFDAPVPFATKGRRDITNVPAQSLTLLNDPFVLRMSERWSARARRPGASLEQIVAAMFESALGRPPTAAESETLSSYVSDLRRSLRDSAAERQRLSEAIETYDRELQQLLQPARAAVEQRAANSPTQNTATPIALWDFETDLRDSIGEMHGKPHGSAKVDDGALILSDGSYVSTSPLQQSLRQKTMTTLVQLDQLGQRGGASMSLQNLRGDVFDAIVYGEETPRQWLAGSNDFARTASFNGPEETEAIQAPIHIAIAYDRDGTIRAYRNGVIYGRSYRKAENVSFDKENAQVLFGLRHGSPQPSRLLQGKVLEARLFDRALSAEEIAAEASGTAVVREEDILAELTDDGREMLQALRSQITSLQIQREALGPEQDEQVSWTRLAHVMFNLKEFIYLD